MKQVDANIWNYYKRPNHIVVIPCVCHYSPRRKKVMTSKGLAAQANHKFHFGLHAYKLMEHYGWNFSLHAAIFAIAPIVDNKRMGAASLIRIEAVCRAIRQMALDRPGSIFVVPRLGCGGGSRSWDFEVRPMFERFFFQVPNVIVVHNSKRKRSNKGNANLENIIRAAVINAPGIADNF